jgi:hypothetical protein
MPPNGTVVGHLHSLARILAGRGALTDYIAGRNRCTLLIVISNESLLMLIPHSVHWFDPIIAAAPGQRSMI